MTRKAELGSLGASVFAAIALMIVDRLWVEIPHGLLWPALIVCVLFFLISLGLLVWPNNEEERRPTQLTSGPTSPIISTRGNQAPIRIENSFNVEVAGKAQPPSWLERAGGPHFSMSPGIDQGRLICQFRISNASLAPGGVRARWVGAGTTMESIAPMLENTPPGATYQKYQMKPIQMMPTAPTDEVTFEVQFNLEDGSHGGRWTWPLRQHEKGHWILDGHLGSRTNQPSTEDAW
jgi:hypothetical protein